MKLLKWLKLYEDVCWMLEQFRSRLGRLFNAAEMKQAYALTFRTGPAERFVLPDLVEFCHAHEPSPNGEGLHLQGRAAGRRDVWLHIQSHLNFTEEELTALYKSRSLPKQGERYA